MRDLTRNKFTINQSLSILAAFLLLLGGARAFAVEFTCESMLVSLARMHAQKLQLRSLDENAGTPENNREAAIVALNDSSNWVNGKVQLKSDLGMSEWTPEELKDWLAMEDSLKTPQAATKRVLEISAEPSRAWPGVSLVLRNAIHDSHELFKAALKAIIAEQDEIVRKAEEDARKGRGVGFVNWPLWVQGRAGQFHRQNDKMNFAWGRSEAELTDGLGVKEGYEILRMIARENLIRHLVYQGLDGRPRTGMDVVLDTRLMIAERPLLAPLMPLLENYPPKLEFNYVYGLASQNFADSMYYHPLNLAVASWPVKYSEHAAFILSLEPGEAALKSISAGVFNIEFDFEDDEAADKARQLEMEREILGRLNSLGEEFRAYLKISKPFSVTGEWDDLGLDLTLHVNGLSRINQILFFYYVAEVLKSSPPHVP